ncbi:probable E3 ubiquitin-protein ligase HERC3 [Alosa sapidissima]|uniref:probable E3 ubiquitin-protein ligase HERC3 n=1 Tax=Alosa sapidissima TaxID=34773 RepID=UPI001C099F25|nr:probable E3 ubiquitin-protein ligase HERC3 [Alosa sapidissima]
MYCWGEAKLQELNILAKKDMCHNFDAVGLQKAVLTKAIRHLSIGDEVTAILWENGFASVAIRKQNGSRWKKISLTRNGNIVAVCVGATHAILLTKKGALLHWSSSDVSSVPKCLANVQNRQVVQIACGDNHSVALIKDGQVFTWGQNSNGQLGLGKGEPSTMSPQPLKSLAGIPLSQISAGGDHTFALSLSGAVFGWGKNSAGQLGLGDLSDRPEPVDVSCLSLKKTIFISCGVEHTAILVKDGVVFTCGSGRYGQLGHNSFRDELRPRLVAELWGSKVSQIACGRYHTLALVESQGTIYAFGCGEQGQLGSGQTDNQAVPLPVDIPQEQNSEGAIKRIFAGANQSFALKKSGEDWVASHPNFDQIKMTWELNFEIADRWISSNSKSWTMTKRNITKILSSVSCVNGSFLEKSSDKHYSTSEYQCGLDLSMARQFFEKLSQSEKVLKEVESVVQQHLLPSLSPSPAGVEGLRVYLILPELLRVLLKQHRGTDLTVLLAEAILRLHPDSLRILERYWSRIGYSFFRTVVKNFHSVSKNSSQSSKKVAEMLQKLYAVNSLRHSRLNDSHFHIKEINNFLFELELMARQEYFNIFFWGESSKFYTEVIQYLTAFPCIFDMEAKQKVFQLNVTSNSVQDRLTGIIPQTNHNTLRVQRQTLLKDTFEYLQRNIHDFHMPLKVKFVEENGIDDGGISQEFFRLLSKALISEDCNLLLEIFEESELVWFMSDECKSVDVYMDIGTIFGMALYNQCLVNIPFPSALFKKLLGERPTLRDLEELSPCQARCLKALLDYEDEELELLEQDFRVKGQDLIPNGGEVFVTKGNRKKFVDLYVDFVFNKSMARQFEAFAEGFGRACPEQTWRMFSPDELRMLICGEAKYEWEDLRKVAKYERCESSDLLILNFWRVLFELSKEDQLKFLSFIYGTDRIPIGGLAKRDMRIVRLNMDNPDEYFPLANACYGVLQLPNYSSVDILRDKLTHAINYCDVFGMT